MGRPKLLQYKIGEHIHISASLLNERVSIRHSVNASNKIFEYYGHHLLAKTIAFYHNDYCLLGMKIKKWIYNYLDIESIMNAMKNNFTKIPNVLLMGIKLNEKHSVLNEQYELQLHKIRGIALLIHTLYFVNDTIWPSEKQKFSQLLDGTRQSLINVMDFYFESLSQKKHKINVMNLYNEWLKADERIY